MWGSSLWKCSSPEPCLAAAKQHSVHGLHVQNRSELHFPECYEQGYLQGGDGSSLRRSESQVTKLSFSWKDILRPYARTPHPSLIVLEVEKTSPPIFRIFQMCHASACARAQLNRWWHYHVLAAQSLKCAQQGFPPGTHPPAPAILGRPFETLSINGPRLGSSKQHDPRTQGHHLSDAPPTMTTRFPSPV